MKSVTERALWHVLHKYSRSIPLDTVIMYLEYWVMMYTSFWAFFSDCKEEMKAPDRVCSVNHAWIVLWYSGDSLQVQCCSWQTPRPWSPPHELPQVFCSFASDILLHPVMDTTLGGVWLDILSYWSVICVQRSIFCWVSIIAHKALNFIYWIDLLMQVLYY